jgi:hypothetical protein
LFLEVKRHPPAAYEVEVQVKNRLPGIRTGVYDQAVPGLIKTGFSSQAVSGKKHVTEQFTVGRFGFIHGYDMLLRDDQDVHGGNRAGILETDKGLIAMEDIGGNISGNDPAEGAAGESHQRKGCKNRATGSSKRNTDPWIKKPPGGSRFSSPAGLFNIRKFCYSFFSSPLI